MCSLSPLRTPQCVPHIMIAAPPSSPPFLSPFYFVQPGSGCERILRMAASYAHYVPFHFSTLPWGYKQWLNGAYSCICNARRQNLSRWWKVIQILRNRAGRNSHSNTVMRNFRERILLLLLEVRIFSRTLRATHCEDYMPMFSISLHLLV